MVSVVQYVVPTYQSTLCYIVRFTWYITIQSASMQLPSLQRWVTRSTDSVKKTDYACATGVFHTVSSVCSRVDAVSTYCFALFQSIAAAEWGTMKLDIFLAERNAFDSTDASTRK